MQFGAVWCIMVWYGAVWCSSRLCCTVLCSVQTNVAYRYMTSPEDYPEPVGRVRPDGRLQLSPKSSANNLFKAIDKFLKDYQVGRRSHQVGSDLS